MNTKLTVRLDQSTIQTAKKYARNHGISLSKMIQFYFQNLVEEKAGNFKPTPLVSELSGILSPKLLPDWKHSYADFLSKKYA